MTWRKGWLPYWIGIATAALGAGWVHPGAGLAVAGLGCAAQALGLPGRRAHEHRERLLADGVARAVRRESGAVQKAWERHGHDTLGLRSELARFYSGHAEYLATSLHMDFAQAVQFCEQRRAIFESSGAPPIANLEERTRRDLLALARASQG